MLPKEHSADWVRAIEHAVSRIEATIVVTGETPEQFRQRIADRVKGIAAPTYVVPTAGVQASGRVSDDQLRQRMRDDAAASRAFEPQYLMHAPCDLAPAGWHCSRPKGHEGPCAAGLAHGVKEGRRG